MITASILMAKTISIQGSIHFCNAVPKTLISTEPTPWLEVIRLGAKITEIMHILFVLFIGWTYQFVYKRGTHWVCPLGTLVNLMTPSITIEVKLITALDNSMARNKFTYVNIWISLSFFCFVFHILFAFCQLQYIHFKPFSEH